MPESLHTCQLSTWDMTVDKYWANTNFFVLLLHQVRWHHKSAPKCVLILLNIYGTKCKCHRMSKLEWTLQLAKHKLAARKTAADAHLVELHPCNQIFLQAGCVQVYRTYFQFLSLSFCAPELYEAFVLSCGLSDTSRQFASLNWNSFCIDLESRSATRIFLCVGMYMVQMLTKFSFPKFNTFCLARFIRYRTKV